MQLVPFSTGGFVAHKVQLPSSKCRFSVWLDATGKVLAVEALDRLNRSVRATPGQIAALQRKARTYFDALPK